MRRTDETIVRDSGPGGSTSYAPPRPDIVVTLVHGTILLARWPLIVRALKRVRSIFRRGSAIPAWHEPGSQFATSLKKSNGERAHITSFNWSGGNTVWDRLSAAGAYGDSTGTADNKVPKPPSLRDHIATIATQHPQAAHVLIGHSHGGSVCLAALDATTRKAVRALVSLSTPFVHVRERPDAKNLRTVMPILGFLIYLTLLIGIPTWLKPRVGEPWNSFIFSIALFGALGLAAFILNRRQKRNAAVRAWSQSVNETPDKDLAQLVLTSDGDEALLALKVAEALSIASRGLWRVTYGIIEMLERSVQPLLRGARLWIIYVGAAFALFEFFLLYDGPLSGEPWTVSRWAKAVGVSLFMPAFLFAIVALLLFVPAMAAILLGFPFLIFFRWLAFGWGGSPGVDLTAESLPLGRVTAVRLPAPADSRPGLRHSIYTDPRVPPVIGDFILSLIDAPTGPARPS